MQTRFGSKTVGMVLVLLCALLFPERSHSLSRKPVDILSIQNITGSPSDFVISATDNFQFYMFALKNPHRLVIDCRPAILAAEISNSLNGTHPVVDRIRADHFQKDVVRVVFDLKQHAKYSALMEGNQLRIRIATSVQQASTPVKDSAPPSQAAPSNAASPSNAVELSVSTESQPSKEAAKSVDQQKTQPDPNVKMRGYVVDRFERKVVGSKGKEPSTGSSYALSLKYRKKNKANNAKIKVDYSIAGHEYAEPYADDYMSQDLKVGYHLKLNSNWTLKNVGSVGMYEYGSEYGVRPEISYDFNDRNEMSFFAGHRTKFLYYNSDRVDQDRFFGLQYKRKLLGNQSFKLAYQRSFNDSEKDRYDFVRSRYTVEYNVPWVKTARSTFRLDYSPREYQSRYIALQPQRDPELGILRYDEGWTFSIVSRIALSRHFELVPRYTFQDRLSNDPSVEDFSLHVSSIALRGRW